MLHNGAKRSCFILRSVRGAMLHLSRRSGFYEARHAAYEAILRIMKHFAAQNMKRSLDRLHFFARRAKKWSEQRDSNPRPIGPKPIALPGCAMLRRGGCAPQDRRTATQGTIRSPKHRRSRRNVAWNGPISRGSGREWRNKWTAAEGKRGNGY